MRLDLVVIRNTPIPALVREAEELELGDTQHRRRVENGLDVGIELLVECHRCRSRAGAALDA